MKEPEETVPAAIEASSSADLPAGPDISPEISITPDPNKPVLLPFGVYLGVPVPPETV